MARWRLTVASERLSEEAIWPLERPRAAHGAHLRADLGRSLPLREEPLGGAYLGLVPARDHSGDRDPREKRISKEGDEMLRKLLVGSAHYVLGPFGSD